MEEWTEWRRAKQKEGGSEKEKHLTLCLAGCRTQLISMLRQQIPTHRTLINAWESVLVTWSSMRSRPFIPPLLLSLSLLDPLLSITFYISPSTNPSIRHFRFVFRFFEYSYPCIPAPSFASSLCCLTRLSPPPI